MAQLVERTAVNRQVVGSSPTRDIFKMGQLNLFTKKEGIPQEYVIGFEYYGGIKFIGPYLLESANEIIKEYSPKFTGPYSIQDDFKEELISPEDLEKLLL